MLTRMLVLLVVVSGFVAQSANASRYAVADPELLTKEQESPLSVTVDLRFPSNYVKTVGDAVNFALMRSGYRLADTGTQEQIALMAMPLPDVHRTFQGQRLSAVLIALGKPGYRVVVDDVNRLVAYELAPKFSGRDVAEPSEKARGDR